MLRTYNEGWIELIGLNGRNGQKLLSARVGILTTRPTPTQTRADHVVVALAGVPITSDSERGERDQTERGRLAA